MFVPGRTARSTPLRARLTVHEHVDDQPNQNNNPCGGARGLSGESDTSSSPRSRRCVRIRSISAGSSMLAITLSRPPQRTHCSISMPNTRFSRRAHVMATCFGVGRSHAPARRRAPDPRPAGVIAARNAAACGAKTP